MPRILDSAHISSVQDNQYMGRRVCQFRKWQNTPIQDIAKSLHVPVKTVHMLEDGELINNKLLLKEAHIVGMGSKHIIALAHQTSSNNVPSKASAQETQVTKHKDMGELQSKPLGYTFFYIIRRAADQKHITLADACRKTGENPKYLGLLRKIPLITFVAFMINLGYKNAQINSILRKHHVKTDMFQSSLYGKILRCCAQHNWSIKRFAHQAKLSGSVIKNIKLGKKVFPRSQHRINTVLKGQKVHIRKSALSKLLSTHGYHTLSSFAKTSGITLGTLSNIEAGTHKPSRPTMRKVASTLHIPINTVMKLFQKSPKYSHTHNTELEKRLHKLNLRIVQQNNQFVEYRNKVSHQLKNLNQAIDYKKLSAWINKHVSADIQQILPKYIDSGEVHRLQALYQHYPKARQIVQALYHADTKQLDALYSIVQTWEYHK